MSNYIYQVWDNIERKCVTRSDMFGGEENLIEVVTTQAESVIDYELGYNVTGN